MSDGMPSNPPRFLVASAPRTHNPREIRITRVPSPGERPRQSPHLGRLCVTSGQTTLHFHGAALRHCSPFDAKIARQTDAQTVVFLEEVRRQYQCKWRAPIPSWTPSQGCVNSALSNAGLRNHEVQFVAQSRLFSTVQQRAIEIWPKTTIKNNNDDDQN